MSRNLEHVNYTCPGCGKPAKGKHRHATVPRQRGVRPDMQFNCRHCGLELRRHDDLDSAPPAYAYLPLDEWRENLLARLLDRFKAEGLDP